MEWAGGGPGEPIGMGLRIMAEGRKSPKRGRADKPEQPMRGEPTEGGGNRVEYNTIQGGERKKHAGGRPRTKTWSNEKPRRLPPTRFVGQTKPSLSN